MRRRIEQSQAEDAPDDDALMARYATGDQAAARALAARRTPQVLALAARMLGDSAEAEDVAQEAMLRLWRIAPEWRPGEAKVSTWLHRVALNLCYDRLRKKRPQSFGDAFPDAPPEIVDETPTAEAEMAKADVGAQVRAALMALPERQRAALVMRHYQERPNDETAAVLGVSVEAVESLLARARRTLKTTLQGIRAP